MKKILIVVIGMFMLSSCTDSTRARLTGYGSNFKIEMVNCDGSISHS